MNNLTIKHHIPRNLHPQLPPPCFVMSELPDYAIVIYHPSDILEGVGIDLVRLSRFGSSHRDRILKYLVMGIHDFLCLPEWIGSEVCTWIIPLGSFARPNLFDDNDSDGEESDDDDDACVDIPLITPIRSAAMIPIGGNQIRGSVPSTVECPSTRASRRKVIMDDALDTPSGSAGRSQAFIGPTPASRDPTGDAIDRDFFPFAPGPYYATYPKDGVVIDSYEVSHEEWDGLHQPTSSIMTKEVFKDPNVCKTVVDQFPSPGKMVKIEALTNDRLARKISVLHCLMMSNGRELLARYKGLESQVSSLKKQVTDLNDKITVSDLLALPLTMNQARDLDAQKWRSD
ncbi:hypothetical protein Tco_1384120 [Tanacetum coccineum]